MAKKIAQYKVFIASPNDVNKERELFRKIIDSYNKNEGGYKEVIFKTIGWEDVYPGVGRPQGLINKELQACDYFVLILHERWGSNPGPNNDNATSGTEEEFKLAMRCYHDESLPMKQVVLLFKSVSPVKLSNPHSELAKVLNFRKQIQRNKSLLYSTFTSESEFKQIINYNLANWLSQEESKIFQGGLHKSYDNNYKLVPDSIYNKDHSNKIVVDSQIIHAWKLAEKGFIIEAEVEFCKAIVEFPTSSSLLNFAQFLFSIGRLSQAEMLLDKIISTKDSNETLINSDSYRLLGAIHIIKSEWFKAKQMHEIALQIDQKGNNKSHTADYYLAMATIDYKLGDWDSAEQYCEKAMSINDKKNKITSNLLTLIGRISLNKGNLNKAEYTLLKQLEIFEKENDKKGKARSFGELANLYRVKGDLDKALTFVNKSITIYSELGLILGESNEIGRLGIIYDRLGNYDKAIEMFEKALEINTKLDRKEDMANQLGNLGNAYFELRKLDKAETMYRRALELNIKIGKPLGIGADYGSLADIMNMKNEFDEAKKFLQKSFDIFEDLDYKEGLAYNYKSLGSIYMGEKNFKEAERNLLKALNISKAHNFNNLIESIESVFDSWTWKYFKFLDRFNKLIGRVE